MTFRESDIHQFETVFGRNLLAEIPNFVAARTLVATMEDIWPLFEEAFHDDVQVYFVRSMERDRLEHDLGEMSDIASVVGLGGGQAIDAAKYLSWRLGRPLFQFPTSLSVDAVFGHRAGVRENSVVRYVGWAVPEAVYLDFDVLSVAPRRLNLGGLGDVLCFITGVMDWRHARSVGKCEEKWPYDDSLAQISLAKAQAVLDALDEICMLQPKGIRVMVDALKWGGASFHGTGWNPRHIEGVEHFIFYALEAGTRKKFLHGQAVCLGLILGCMMHEQRSDELLGVVHKAGIDIRPEAMDVSWDDVNRIMRGLSVFVRKEGLAYGIAHDFDVTDSFLNDARNSIEGTFGPWTR